MGDTGLVPDVVGVGLGQGPCEPPASLGRQTGDQGKDPCSNWVLFGCSYQFQALQGLETWLSLGFSLPNLPFLLLDLLGAVQIGILEFWSKLLPPRTPLS